MPHTDIPECVGHNADRPCYVGHRAVLLLSNLRGRRCCLILVSAVDGKHRRGMVEDIVGGEQQGQRGEISSPDHGAMSQTKFASTTAVINTPTVQKYDAGPDDGFSSPERR